MSAKAFNLDSEQLRQAVALVDARSESEAERIFKETYPAVHEHLNRYTNGLKERSKSVQGKFYWEMSNKRLYSMPECPKIIYPLHTPSMQAVYDTLEGFPTSSFHIILTTDLSLLAILNSKLFAWYAHREYWSPEYNQLNLRKQNMERAPIAPRTEEQKAKLSGLVQQLLDNPNGFAVPDVEREIDQLVYELYELTEAEIALIEKGNNQ